MTDGTDTAPTGGPRLEDVHGDNWRDFLASDRAVLVLGKSDCGNCATWAAELADWLADDRDWKDVRFGKMTLDTKGLTEFKKENRWLAEVDVLPFNVVYKGGERAASYAGGGRERLENRLRRLFREDA
jgi:hypothetical protein